MSDDTTRADQERRTSEEAGLPPWNERTALYSNGILSPRFGNLPLANRLMAVARAWLRELAHVVPSTYGRKMAGEVSFPPDYEGADNLRTVRLEHGQVLTLRLNAYIDYPRPDDDRSFRRAEVRGFAQRTDKATLAALSVLEGSGVRVGGRDRIRRHLGREHDEAYTGKWNERDELIPEEERLLAFAQALLRHHRPTLDQASPEGMEILVGTCSRVAQVAEGARRLNEYLEFGVDGRDTRKDIEDAEMAVYAAELSHIVGMNQQEVAQKLRLPLSKRDQNKGEHRGAGGRIKRGVAIFEEALSRQGWQRYKQLLRDEYEESRGSAPPSE